MANEVSRTPSLNNRLVTMLSSLDNAILEAQIRVEQLTERRDKLKATRKFLLDNPEYLKTTEETLALLSDFGIGS